MKRFAIFSSIIFIVLVITLIGCQRSMIPQESMDGKYINETHNNKVIIRFGWWGSEVRHRSILDGLKVYMQEHPSVKLIGEYSDWSSYYQRLVTQLAGGNAPDIIVIDQLWLNDFAAQGEMFVDLYKHKDKIDFNKLDRKLLKDFIKKNEQLHGIPLGSNVSTIIYNKRIVDMTGISLDENSQWDWDTFLNEGKKFKKKYPDLTFLHADLFSLELFILRSYAIQKTGNQWVKEDYTIGFNKKTLTEAFGYIKQLFDNKIIEHIGETMPFNGKIGTAPQWLNGKCALTLGWSSDIPDLTNPNVEIGVAQFPITKDAKETGIYTKPTIVISINKKSPHIDENIRFLSWLINNQEMIPYLYNVNDRSYINENKEFLANEYKINRNIEKALQIALKKSATSVNGVSNNSELMAITYDIIQKVAYGRLTPEHAADSLIRQFNEKLQEIRENKK